MRMMQDLLKKNKAAILERWLHLILETYPANTAAMMRKDKNQFTNPVGSTLSREIDVLFKNLCEGSQDETCQPSLDSILKIRSVQDFSPSKAVGFIFFLKRAIGETLKNEMCKESAMDEWLEFQSRIDDLALQAFDIYMDCREKICEIRINQARAEKEMAFRMMERITTSKEKRLKGKV
jgi:RsbT co-antagonist protein rsbRD N-terminal domain